MSGPNAELLRRIAALLRDGTAAALCLVVDERGSTPQGAGAVMFVDDLGRIHGTIGGGCVEAEVRRLAMPLIAPRRSAIFRFRLDGDYGWDDGLICGGAIEVAIAPAPPAEALERLADEVERSQPALLEIEVGSDARREHIVLHLPPRLRLLIAGAGHIGRAVARLAAALDFDVTVFDDRPDLLGALAPSVGVACGPIALRLADTPMSRHTFCVIVTRGHRHDAQALAAVLDRRTTGELPGYVGMIGSRRKVALTFEELEERGIPRDRLDLVRAPIGLPIGAETVEEIAVSIAAQLVEARAALRGGRRSHGRKLIERRLLPPHAGHDARPIGVLLAAGRSRRMGCTKQTLPLPGDSEGRALVAAACDAVASACREMIVVVSHDADAVAGSLGERRCRTVRVGEGEDMSQSVFAGLREAHRIDPAAPVLLHLADHPRVSPASLESICRAGADHPHCAIIPVFQGRGGHPVLIPPVLIPAILDGEAARRPGGLREFWAAHPDCCLRLPVEDASILVDVDCPGDYRGLLQGVT